MDRLSISRNPRPGLVVIGASAGGVETLRRVVGGLPADLNATVCIVLHMAPGSPSALAAILDRASELTVRAARQTEVLRPGEVLVAPPDHHLLITGGQAALNVGPRENGHRPAVDPLFRSAAAAHDRRVVGVVLSGTRDDGTAGLAVIKANGGKAIVQDPEEALYSGMPANAIAHVEVDRILPSGEIADAIAGYVNGPDRPEGADPPGGTTKRGAGAGDPVSTICPECGGVLSEVDEGGLIQWSCRVGHRYSAESLADAQAEDVEAALWSAIRALEDRRRLLDRMADQLEAGGHPAAAEAFRRRGEQAEAQVERVRRAVASAAPSTLRRVADADDVEHEPGAVGGGG